MNAESCLSRTPYPRLSAAVLSPLQGDCEEELSTQRLVQILEEVVDVFETDREPDEIVRYFEGGALHGRMGHDRRHLDQRLDPAQALGQDEEAGG